MVLFHLAPEGAGGNGRKRFLGAAVRVRFWQVLRLAANILARIALFLPPETQITPVSGAIRGYQIVLNLIDLVGGEGGI